MMIWLILKYFDDFVRVWAFLFIYFFVICCGLR